MSAPAPANAGIYSSGLSIIRCTSRVMRVALRKEATTGTPMEMFGTKCPSITSTCSIVAPPRSTARIPSPRDAKFAASMEGAISMGKVTFSPLLSYQNRALGCTVHGGHAEKSCVERGRESLLRDDQLNRCVGRDFGTLLRGLLDDGALRPLRGKSICGL